MSDAIVITGCGWSTPDGLGTAAEVLERLARARSAVAADWARAVVAPEDAEAIGPHGGAGNRLAAVALTATRIALRQAGVVPSEWRERCGLQLGTLFGGQSGMISFGQAIKQSGSRFVTPLTFPETVGNYAASTVARILELEGPDQTVCAGADSGLTAVIEAMRLLRTGHADVVLAGGADVLVEELAAALYEAGGDELREFATLRGGRLAEGACVLALERAEVARRRGAPPLAMIERLADGAGGHADERLSVAGGASRACRDRARAWAGAMGLSAREAIVANRIWGEAFAMGSAAQVGLGVAAVAGYAVPVAGLAEAARAAPPSVGPLPGRAVVAVGGENVPPELVVRISRAAGA